MIEAPWNHLRFNALFFIFTVSVEGKIWQLTNVGKSDCLFQVFFVMFICHTPLEYPYKMNQIEYRYCVMFVAQHYTGKTKASAQGSSWRYKKRLSRNQVKAWATNGLDEWAPSFLTARLTWFLTGSYHWNENLLIWCLSETFTSSWEVEKCKMRKNVKTKVFKTNSSGLFRTEDEHST